MISDEFDVKSVQSSFAVVFDVAKQIPVIKVHDDTQILTSILEGCKGSNHFHDKLCIQHGNYFNLSVLVFGVLKNLFYCDEFSCFYDSAFIDFAESSLPD